MTDWAREMIEAVTITDDKVTKREEGECPYCGHQGIPNEGGYWKWYCPECQEEWEFATQEETK